MSERQLWRNIQMVAARSGGASVSAIAAANGISPSRVSQIVDRYTRRARTAQGRLAEFKQKACAEEIIATKREYDRLPDAEKQARKAEMAAEIDRLLSHLRSAEEQVSTSR